MASCCSHRYWVKGRKLVAAHIVLPANRVPCANACQCKAHSSDKALAVHTQRSKQAHAPYTIYLALPEPGTDAPMRGCREGAALRPKDATHGSR